MSSARDLVTASADVRHGKLVIRNRRQFDQLVREFKDGIQVEVSVSRLFATRSQRQNKFWWGVCVQLVSEHTGYSPEEIHEIAKQLFLPKTLAVLDGHGDIKGEFTMGGSTRTLTTKEFGEFIERFRQWAAETLDVNIPDPEGAF